MTVKMKKGDKFADIFDSPETIRQAQLDGYSLVEDSEKKEEKTETFIEEEKTEKKRKIKD